eukprot:COSAG04_NODE_504_length_13347_cov_231.910251_11_plen_86_part_00
MTHEVADVSEHLRCPQEEEESEPESEEDSDDESVEAAAAAQAAAEAAAGKVYTRRNMQRRTNTQLKAVCAQIGESIRLAMVLSGP